MVDISQTPETYQARANHVTARLLSVLAALAVDFGLAWLFYERAPFDPPFGDAEMFWVRIVAGFGAYAVLQHWTLANQSGRGDNLWAAIDKAAAISPLLVVASLEAYWLSVGVALSWRHHAVALLWAGFALTDFFATETTNQRLTADRFSPDDRAN
jgi:hypothetical protein